MALHPLVLLLRPPLLREPWHLQRRRQVRGHHPRQRRSTLLVHPLLHPSPLPRLARHKTCLVEGSPQVRQPASSLPLGPPLLQPLVLLTLLQHLLPSSLQALASTLVLLSSMALLRVTHSRPSVLSKLRLAPNRVRALAVAPLKWQGFSTV